MIEDPKPSAQDRFVALMGLATRVPDQAEVCPSDERLAVFASGGLKGRERRLMLAHLNRCRHCYYEWLEVGSYLEDALCAETRPAQSTFDTRQILNWLESVANPWRIALPAAAAFALLGVLMLHSADPGLRQIIEAEYTASANLYADAVESDGLDLPLPWENAALGFSETASSAEKKAFGAGMWAGKQELSGAQRTSLPAHLSNPAGGAWKDTQWADYFEFGKWSLLMQARMQSDTAHWDWDRQRAILTALSRRFAEQGPHDENAQASAALERLRAPLQEAAANQRSGAQANFSRQLTLAIHTLAP